MRRMHLPDDEKDITFSSFNEENDVHLGAAGLA